MECISKTLKSKKHESNLKIESKNMEIQIENQIGSKNNGDDIVYYQTISRHRGLFLFSFLTRPDLKLRSLIMGMISNSTYQDSTNKKFRLKWILKILRNRKGMSDSDFSTLTTKFGWTPRIILFLLFVVQYCKFIHFYCEFSKCDRMALPERVHCRKHSLKMKSKEVRVFGPPFQYTLNSEDLHDTKTSESLVRDVGKTTSEMEQKEDNAIQDILDLHTDSDEVDDFVITDFSEDETLNQKLSDPQITELDVETDLSEMDE